MGRRRLDQINHLVKAGYGLRVTCLGCGHIVVLDALAISLSCRSAKDRSLEMIEARLKCVQCGERKAACQPVEQ